MYQISLLLYFVAQCSQIQGFATLGKDLSDSTGFHWVVLYILGNTLNGRWAMPPLWPVLTWYSYSSAASTWTCLMVSSNQVNWVMRCRVRQTAANEPMIMPSVFIYECKTHNQSCFRGAMCVIRQQHRKNRKRKKLTTLINKLPIPLTISSNERERERERERVIEREL